MYQIYYGLENINNAMLNTILKTDSNCHFWTFFPYISFYCVNLSLTIKVATFFKLLCVLYELFLDRNCYSHRLILISKPLQNEFRFVSDNFRTNLRVAAKTKRSKYQWQMEMKQFLEIAAYMVMLQSIFVRIQFSTHKSFMFTCTTLL